MKTKTLSILMLAAVGLGVIALAPTPAKAQAAATEAKQFQSELAFVNKFTSEGLDFLSDKGMTLAQKRARFNSLLTKNFDISTIGQFVLGTYWRQATPAQRTEYQKLFKDMVVDIYTNRFNEYNGEKVVTKGARQVPNSSDVAVTSHIMPLDGSEPVPVEWRVRNRDGNMKVVDVKVAGVSMSVTQRSDFASVIQRGGGNVDALIQHLRTQTGK